MTSASKIYPALTLEVMISREEGQYYDVKSAQKKPSELADIVSAYANAEGRNRRHRHQRQDTQTRKLTVEEIRQLEYEKGVAHYEEEVCQYATMEDLDSELLDSYRQKIGAAHQNNEQVLRARQFIVKRHGEDMLTNAAVLMFGKNVRGFFPHCRIRYIKVNGTAMRTRAEFNVVKGRSFDLPLLRLIPETKRFVSDQLDERTTLESDGRFHTYPEYPEFAWVESITNAVCHRQWGPCAINRRQRHLLQQPLPKGNSMTCNARPLMCCQKRATSMPLCCTITATIPSEPVPRQYSRYSGTSIGSILYPNSSDNETISLKSIGHPSPTCVVT